MEISGISSSAVQSAASQATASDAVGISMLKKTMDIQASTAQQLIESVAKSVPSPEGNLGQNIDIRV